jgi:hypothetical protein
MGIANKGWINVSDDGVISLEPLEKGIFLQPNTIYYMGASSSPSMIIVSKVEDTHIEYYNYPYETPHRMERDTGEDLITRGCRRWMENHKDVLLEPGYEGFARMYASFKDMLAGKPSDCLVSVDDYKRVHVEVEVAKDAPDYAAKDDSWPSESVKIDFWRELEQYGSVGGRNPPGAIVGQMNQRLMRYIVSTTKGELKALKNDKKFKVIGEVNM